MNNKLIPLMLVVLVVGGGGALAYFAYTAKESYAPGAGSTTPTRATTPEGTAADTGDASESIAGNEEVLRADAEALYEKVINRDLALGERRRAAIMLGKHPTGHAFIERILNDESFIREGENEVDAGYMLDMNIFIALLMNVRHDTTSEVLIALTGYLDDQRFTRMLEDDWAPAEEGEGEQTEEENRRTEGGEREANQSGSGRRNTGMTSGIGGIRPNANSVAIREYAMMALERALDVRHRYNVDSWLGAIRQSRGG